MLEVCPSIASEQPSLQVHPLGIGGKADPARLVFDTTPGPGLNASLLDMGNRFRLLVNEVEVTSSPAMPKLPVAHAIWTPKPNFEDACACWIHAGGAHHTAFSQAATTEMIEDFATIADIELAVIDGKANVRDFQQTLRNNEVYYALSKGWTV
jgi:L-arabinose isomerase